MAAQTIESLKELVSKCSCGNYEILVREDGDRPYLQVVFEGADSVTGKVEVQYCRKWFLSLHMCDSEVVRTAFLAVQQAAIHEVQESFRFMGKSIFNPHRSVYALAGICGPETVDVRS